MPSDASTPAPWPQAWAQALYGPAGFYRRPEGPAGHFATSSHGPAGILFAAALARLARREGVTTIVDVGAGRAELLGRLAQADPALTLVGVDVVARATPVTGAPVAWRVAHTGAGQVVDLRDLGPALVVANEWLDVVPCTIGEYDGRGRLREVLVDRAGAESLGRAIDGRDADWVATWWPGPATRGRRVEIGRSRDDAYAALLAACAPGSLVAAIDYGHRRGERPPWGSLTGYRRGEQVPPRPDGSCDLTAHVAMDALGPDRLVRQRDILAELGVTAQRPDYAQARRDPAGYLRALQDASAAAELTGSGLGGFWWALSRT